jgi:hypothetical protein
MKIFILLLPLFIFFNSCSNPFSPSKELFSIDTAKLKKSYFELKNDSVHQTVRIIWLNDTSVTAEVNAGNSSYGSYLSEKYSNADYEIEEDSSGNSHPMREFTMVAKNQGNLSLKIALDTSFAVIPNWQFGPDSSSVILNKIMYRQKQ